MLMKTPLKTADQLGISDKVYKALLEVKHEFEAGNISPSQFCMAVVRTHPMECGTIACIGGWVGIYMNLGVEATHKMVCSSYGPIRALYFPDRDKTFPICGKKDAYTASPTQAAQAIDNFLLTGEPKWDEVMEL